MIANYAALLDNVWSMTYHKIPILERKTLVAIKRRQTPTPRVGVADISQSNMADTSTYFIIIEHVYDNLNRQLT